MILCERVLGFHQVGEAANDRLAKGSGTRGYLGYRGMGVSFASGVTSPPGWGLARPGHVGPYHGTSGITVLYQTAISRKVRSTASVAKQ